MKYKLWISYKICFIIKKNYSIFWNSNKVQYICLSPVHTKDDNYKDNDIIVHTSERYRLFILSTSASLSL